MAIFVGAREHRVEVLQAAVTSVGLAFALLSPACSPKAHFQLQCGVGSFSFFLSFFFFF